MIKKMTKDMSNVYENRNNCNFHDREKQGIYDVIQGVNDPSKLSLYNEELTQ